MTPQQRWQIRQKEKGLCQCCTQPIDPNHLALCTKHLEMRKRRRRGRHKNRYNDDRKEYLRAYKKKYRASEHGKDVIKRLYLKTRVEKGERQQRRVDRGKRSGYKTWTEFFSERGMVSILPLVSIQDPHFLVEINGTKKTEWLSAPLPTWTDANGVIHGGIKWNGADWV